MKLAFIVPTNKSKEEEILREKLFFHMEYFLKDKEKLDWKLFFIEQLTNKPLNWGKCFNIGAKFVTTDEEFYNYYGIEEPTYIKHFFFFPKSKRKLSESIKMKYENL